MKIKLKNSTLNRMESNQERGRVDLLCKLVCGRYSRKQGFCVVNKLFVRSLPPMFWFMQKKSFRWHVEMKLQSKWKNLSSSHFCLEASPNLGRAHGHQSIDGKSKSEHAKFSTNVNFDLLEQIR